MARRLSIAAVLVMVLGAGGYLAFVMSRLYLFRAGFGGSYTYHLLFHSAPWALLAAAGLGVFFGASVEGRRRSPEILGGKILRHDEVAFLEHWTHALSTLLLLVTGIYLGFLFFPRLVQAPPATGFLMNLHFVGVAMFLFSLAYYLTEAGLNGTLQEHWPEPGDFKAAVLHYTAKLGVGKAPEEGKYLASERLAYVGWVVGVAGIVVTGAVKVAAHVWSLPGAFMGAVTFLHDLSALAMLLMLAAHVVASSLAPWSWQLLRSMVTGYVSVEYARRAHPKWYAEVALGGAGRVPEKTPAVPDRGAGFPAAP